MKIATAPSTVLEFVLSALVTKARFRLLIDHYQYTPSLNALEASQCASGRELMPEVVYQVKDPRKQHAQQKASH